MTLKIIRVVKGEFPFDRVTIYYDLGTSCDYFGPVGKNRFITVFPYRYAEGDFYKDKMGNMFVLALQIPVSVPPDFVNDPRYLDFEKVPFQLSCMRRAKRLEKAEDKCRDAENPNLLYNESGSNGQSSPTHLQH